MMAYYDIAVIGGGLLLHYHVIAAVDAGLDHGIAADGKQERCGIADDFGWEGDGVGDVLLVQDGRTGCDIADQRKVDQVAEGGLYTIVDARSRVSSSW